MTVRKIPQKIPRCKSDIIHNFNYFNFTKKKKLFEKFKFL